MNASHRPTLTSLLVLVAVSACDNSTSSTAPPAPATAQAPAAAPAAAVAEAEPAVAAMALAESVQTGKVGVPVEVRYVLAGVAAKDQPAPLDLAFVPRVEGANLEVTFIGSEATSIDAGAAALKVANAATASVHRRRLTVTPKAGDAGSVRVQVTMDVAGGRYSSIFAIPVAATRGAGDAKQPRN